MMQFPGMPLHQGSEGRVFPGSQPRHVFPVFRVDVCDSHGLAGQRVNDASGYGVRNNCAVRHPFQVTLALGGGHGLAHLVKSLQHLLLALDTELGGFGERSLDFGSDGAVTGREQVPEVLVFGINSAAAFGATSQVRLVDT